MWCGIFHANCVGVDCCVPFGSGRTRLFFCVFVRSGSRFMCGMTRRGAVHAVFCLGAASSLPFAAVGACTQAGVFVLWSKRLETLGRQTDATAVTD